MIKADNKKRQEWNQTVDTALVAGVEQDKLTELKRELITLPVQESVKASVEQPEISTPKSSIRSRLAEKKQKVLQSKDNSLPKHAYCKDTSL